MRRTPARDGVRAVDLRGLREWDRWAWGSLLLAVLAAALVHLAGCAGEPASPGETARAAARLDSLSVELERARTELAWTEAELRAAGDRSAYLVLDLPARLLRLEMSGTTFDSLAVEDVKLERSGVDSLRFAPYRRIVEAETLLVRPARLEADTTRDKSAAALARILPPRPKALRYVVHAEGVTVRFTADDPPGLWNDVRILLSRSYGTPPASVPPPARIDVNVAGADLSRLDHFVEAGMPLLIRFGSDR